MKNDIRLAGALFAFAAALAAATSPAWGQAAATPRVLSRDELRACLDEGDALEKKRVDFVDSSAALAKETQALQQDHDEIDQEIRNAQGNSLREERVQRRQQRYLGQAKAMQAKVDSQRATGEALQKDLEAHNGRCANVSVLKEDKDAVMQERAAAGKK